MRKIWRECGFADFADGTFGNAGQSIYVSRAGVLERIFSLTSIRTDTRTLSSAIARITWSVPPRTCIPIRW